MRAIGTVCCERQFNKSFSPSRQDVHSTVPYRFAHASYPPSGWHEPHGNVCTHAPQTHHNLLDPEGRADQCSLRLRRSRSVCVRCPLPAVRRQPTAARAHHSTNLKLGQGRRVFRCVGIIFDSQDRLRRGLPRPAMRCGPGDAMEAKNFPRLRRPGGHPPDPPWRAALANAHQHTRVGGRCW